MFFFVVVMVAAVFVCVVMEVFDVAFNIYLNLYKLGLVIILHTVKQ